MVSRSCLNQRHTSNMRRTLYGNKMFCRPTDCKSLGVVCMAFCMGRHYYSDYDCVADSPFVHDVQKEPLGILECTTLCSNVYRYCIRYAK